MNIKTKFEEYVISKNDKIKFSSIDIKKGDVFLALKGKKNHGNKFINSSIKNGAKFCLTDKVYKSNNQKIIYVKNIFDYLKKLAKRKRNLYKGKIIGITGSAGKTTLKETLAFFLKKDHVISFSKKSYNNELGVLISLLNLDLSSSYSIFEIGTNNFGEIKYLTKLVEPEEIFITNIQNTHLENFKSKKNIALEKSNIFKFINNNNRKKLYINVKNTSEKTIFSRAKKESGLKIIRIDDSIKKYFIKKIISKKNSYQVILSINNKNIILNTKHLIMFRIINLLFCYAFFSENSLNIKTIQNTQKNLKPVDGRGLSHNILFNKKKVRLIDESYNANPDTTIQSINYFTNIKKHYDKKILILGNMNELGQDSNKLHLRILHEIEKYNFKYVILSGEFYKKSIKKLQNPINKFFYFENKTKIMNFLKKYVLKNDIILIKCSNVTEINKLAKELLKKKDS